MQARETWSRSTNMASPPVRRRVVTVVPHVFGLPHVRLGWPSTDPPNRFGKASRYHRRHHATAPNALTESEWRSKSPDRYPSEPERFAAAKSQTRSPACLRQEARAQVWQPHARLLAHVRHQFRCYELLGPFESFPLRHVSSPTPGHLSIADFIQLEIFNPLLTIYFSLLTGPASSNHPIRSYQHIRWNRDLLGGFQFVFSRYPGVW
jgi:hypothetical protein